MRMKCSSRGLTAEQRGHVHCQPLTRLLLNNSLQSPLHNPEQSHTKEGCACLREREHTRVAMCTCLCAKERAQRCHPVAQMGIRPRVRGSIWRLYAR